MDKVNFLIVDSPIFRNFSNEKSKNCNGKKRFDFNYKYRIFEQINNFISLNYQLHSNGLVFVTIVNGFPISSLSFSSSPSSLTLLKKEPEIFLKLLEENLIISEINQEIKKIKNSHSPKNFLLSLNFVFFIIHELLRKIESLKTNIFCLATKKIFLVNHSTILEGLSICKRLNCLFNFITFGENLPFLKFLAFFSGGFFFELKKEINKLVYCDKFLQLLLNLFLVNNFHKELFIKPIFIKSCWENTRNSFIAKIKKCGICHSSSKSTFSNCIICGNSHIFKIN